ncbi:zinc finger matrin-type protein 5 isoform X2 [Equus przewalskii]|uniref:Zinc finger matrin-type protein 5 isoform X2 n=1 Tax=Equus przewalskii TaxID=9798 RepID=A0ABM2EIT0_EQUPR|nr:PREDICTED: zinc finger matrin-type protein 5 isoform X2 [Equus przewalskii]
MGKRYFCDYCDRSFQDNLHNRKKHLNGLQHLKAKKVWYDMFRDAAAILLDEQNKRPCRKFLLTGQCDFGSNCRFSHMSERDLQELSIQVEGLNPSDPLSSSTPWAGHQFRNCRHPCGHPHPGGGPCSPASSGAEPLIPTCSALESVTINIRAHSGEAEPPSCCAPWSL